MKRVDKKNNEESNDKSLGLKLKVIISDKRYYKRSLTPNRFKIKILILKKIVAKQVVFELKINFLESLKLK